MLNNIKKLLAAAAISAGGMLCFTQQVFAIQTPVRQEIPADEADEQQIQQAAGSQETDDPENSKTQQEAAKGRPLKIKAKDQVILAAPDTLEAVKTAYQSVTLKWSRVDAAAGYQVEYSADGKHYTAAGKTAADVQTYQCRKLLTGTEYQFRVCALDDKGRFGNYASVKAVPVLAKTKFTKSEVLELKKIVLEWKKVSGAESYHLYRKAEGDAGFKVIAVTAEPSYTDTAVKAGGVYTYRVCAVRKAGGRSIKAKLSAKVQAAVTMPAAELESCTAADHKSVVLTWKQADAVSGYYIYRSVRENGTYRKIKTVSSPSVLSYTDTGVVPGKKFYYKICTYLKASDKTVMLGAQSAFKQVQTQMDAPKLTAVKASSSSRGLILTWEKQEGMTGYRIYRSLNPDKGFAKIADVADGGASQYEDRSAAPGGTYYYRIKAVYANRTYKGLSQASSILEGNVLPGAPIGITVIQTATDSLEISWRQSSGARSYNLYRSEGTSAVYTCIAQGTAGTRYTDTGLDNNKTYSYRAAAVGAAGEGAKCRPVSYTVGSVALNTRTLKLCVGASKPLAVSTFRQGRVVWKSDNPKIAEVDTEGVVTGIAYGTVNITATVAGKSASAVVSVTPGKKNGIDVSRWQEDIDWCRVKNSGVEFAFLRISSHYDEDYTFESKYADAAAVEIPLGVYCYSRAATVEEARQEAQTVLAILNGRKLDYPVALDMEDAVHKSEKLTKEDRHQMIQAFKQVVEDAGYRFVLYSYVSFINTYLDKTKLDGIDLWLARYRSVSLGTGYTGTGNQKYWQYNSGQYAGSDSHVDGITDTSGNLVSVDVNIEF